MIASTCYDRSMTATPSVVVVGAGIVGASIAWHLCGLGAKVTILDAAEPGGVATANSWAWINASWGNPEPYFRFRIAAMESWRRLQLSVPGLDVTWSGSLSWELAPDRREAFIRDHRTWGYDIRRVERAEIRAREPTLAAPPSFAAYSPDEGFVEPLAATRSLLADARAGGAAIVSGAEVNAIDIRAGRAVAVGTSAGRIEADSVVLAAGAGTSALLQDVGVSLPVSAPPATLSIFAPTGRLLNGMVMTPQVQLRQGADGRLVAATATEPDDADGARLVETVRSLFQGNPSLSLQSSIAAPRPMLPDGLPAIGPAPGIDRLHVAVTHSGITLAALIGCLVAHEIVAGRRDPILSPYGPDRFVPANRDAVLRPETP